MFEVIYRIFAVGVVIAIEVVVYMALQLGWIKPANDVYTVQCAQRAEAGVNCEESADTRGARGLYYGVLGVTGVLGLVYIGLPIVRGTKKRKVAKADSVEETEAVEDAPKPKRKRKSKAEPEPVEED